MKKFLAIVLTVILALSFAACGGKNYDYKEYDYKEIDFRAIRSEYEDNNARAKENYIGDYGFAVIELTGIWSKESFKGESIISIDNDWFSYYVDCSVKDEELQQKVLTMDKGDKVEVKGKITGFGGYNNNFFTIEMEIYEINYRFS